MKYAKITIADNDNINIPPSRLCKVYFDDAQLVRVDGNIAVESHESGGFFRSAIYLNTNYDWVLGQDNLGNTILVPLKKEGIREL